MIKANLKIADSNFQLKINLELPVLPNIGDQFFLGDFMDESEEEELMKIKPTTIVDDFFVVSIVWFYSKKDNEPYVMIWLNEK